MRKWSYATQLILEEHYNTLVEQTISEFQERTDQVDWFHAFETASSCAKRNFRNRIDSDMFERVEALFAAEMCDETETSRGNEATGTQCTANTRPSNKYAEVVSTDTPRVVRPNAGVQHIIVQIQTSPRRDKNTGEGSRSTPLQTEGTGLLTRNFHRWFEPPPAIQPTHPDL